MNGINDSEQLSLNGDTINLYMVIVQFLER